jgi:hypothetical protein
MIPVPQKKGRGRPRKYLRLEDVLEWRQQKKDKDSKEKKDNCDKQTNATTKPLNEEKAKTENIVTTFKKSPDFQKHLHQQQPVIEPAKNTKSIEESVFEKNESAEKETDENVNLVILKLTEEMNAEEGDESITFYVDYQGFISLTFLRRNS